MITRKELQQFYGKGEKKIRQLLRDAGITHRKNITSDEYELFKKVAGRPRFGEPGYK
jgi:hypothetical protein